MQERTLRIARVDVSFEPALLSAIDAAGAPPCPPILSRALRYAVLPGGARVRPRLTMAVAQACGLAHLELARAGAVAIELLHSASLVHDDLPMFDDADERRGRPAVHRAFSPAIAVLVGDALIVQAFDVLARAEGPREVAAAITRAVAESVGAPRGIVAGQAWESEPELDLSSYHRAKTAALFVGAVVAGALAGGGDAEDWVSLGLCIGEAYQVADDLRDVLSTREALGKPVGQDQALDRPSAVRDLGVGGAQRRLAELVGRAEESVPFCPQRGELVGELRAVLGRVL